MPAETPGWIDALLNWQLTWVATRIALASPFVLGGLSKLAHLRAAVAEQEHFGLHPARLWAVLAILTELLGSALVISGHLVWLGAGALGALTAVAMMVADDFWAKSGPDRVAVANTFFEHLGLIAGLVLVAVVAVRV